MSTPFSPTDSPGVEFTLNPEYKRNDVGVFEEFHGPGSGKTEENDDLPEEIREVFEEHDLFKKTFRCVLWETGGMQGDKFSPSNSSVVKSYSNMVPSMDYIAKNYGPGSYFFAFTYSKGAGNPGTNEEKKKADEKARQEKKTVPFIISEKMREVYDAYQFDKKIKLMEARKKRIRDLKMNGELDKAIMGDSDDVNKQSAKEYVKEILDVAGSLGLNRGSSTDWGALIASAAPIALPLLNMMMENSRRADEKATQMQMLMINMMQQGNKNLVDIMANNQQQGGAQQTFDLMKGMFSNMLDFKEEIKERTEESSGVDRIIDMIAKAMPMIAGILTMSAAQRQANPMVRMAVDQVGAQMNQNPDFQAVKNNPEVLKELILKTDPAYGWEAIDGLLNIAGMVRPDDCPRLAHQRYPQNSGKNPPPEGQ
jgi:hypothetical protein